MKILKGLSQYFSLKLLKTSRIVFGVFIFLGLLSPVPLLDELLFIVLFAVSHFLLKEKEAEIRNENYMQDDNYQLLKDEIEKSINSLNSYIIENELDKYDDSIPGQIKDIEDIINQNFEVVKTSTIRLKQLSFNPKQYDEKRKDILNSLEGNIPEKERKYLEETLKNLLEYKSSVYRLIAKRREIIAVIENLYYQIKTLYAKLLNQDVRIQKEEPFKKLKNEIDEIIKSVEDIEKAKKETDIIINSIHDVM